MNETRWGLDVLIGLPVAGVFALVGFGALVTGLWMFKKRTRKSTGFSFKEYNLPAKSWFFSGLALLVVTVGITASTMYPYEAQYHQWKPVNGTVGDVQARLLADGNGGATQRFVVRLDGGEQEYACDDTRCALLKVGDFLELSCVREWQYAGTDGWACNYFSSRRQAPR